MADVNEYTPHPAKAFFAVFLSGAFLVGGLSLSKSSYINLDQWQYMSPLASNTAGYWLASIVVAFSSHWRLSVFLKIILFHVIGASLIGFLAKGSSGLAYALGNGIAFGLIYAAPCWLMLSRDWLIGRILFWGLVAFMVVGISMLLLR